MIEACAFRLREAYAGGQFAPLRDALGPIGADRAYAVHRPDPHRAILIELGRRKTVGGQDDMITDVAPDIAASKA